MQHVYDIDVRVPMRDGVALAANVWRLAEGKGPTLLVRLPYGKDEVRPVVHGSALWSRWPLEDALDRLEQSF